LEEISPGRKPERERERERERARGNSAKRGGNSNRKTGLGPRAGGQHAFQIDTKDIPH
jgi:hypothetical protein